MRIGVLSVQGAFLEHEQALSRALETAGLEGEIVQVRRPAQAEACHGLVLPGGESTAIFKLLRASDLFEPLREHAEAGTPVLATCAGAILLSKEGDDQVEATDTELLGVLDAAIQRNAFGRQRESFEAGVDIPALGDEPFPGVFIRAPAFQETWDRAAPWARLGGEHVVGIEQDNVLALTFHPELSRDHRIHGYFLEKVQEASPTLYS